MGEKVMSALLQSPDCAKKNGPETLRQQRPALTKTSDWSARMAKASTIEIDLLRQLLIYDPATGSLTWIERPRGMFQTKRHCSVWNARYAGKEAITAISGGYRVGNLQGQMVKAHRIAWALHYGKWPARDIDHINGNRSDNRIENLREVDHTENMRNLPLRRSNSSGVTGVNWDKRRAKWRVCVGKEKIGFFDDFKQAVEVRKSAAFERGYHKNHGRRQ